MRQLLEIHPGGEAPRECAAVAPWLADRARGRLAGAEADHVGEHLAQCADCRETLAALELVWRTESGARPDLWGRVTARLASEPRPARFQLPADEWRRAALAAAILISLSWLVPGARAVTTLMLFGVG